MAQPVSRVLVRLLAATLGLLALTLACGGDSSADEAASSGEHIRGLVPGDTLLVSDPIGSFLGEFNERGQRLTEVALVPYGAARHDESAEARKYAGAPRDAGVGLDHMGARFYAPELGVWTSADPLVLSEPQRLITAEFGAANPYAYANLRPVTATDPDGRFWQAALGILVGGGGGGAVEMLRQYAEHGAIQDWGRVGAAATGGAIAGGAVAMVPAAAGVVATAAITASASAAGGVAQRLIASGGQSAGTVTQLAVDAAAGAAGGALGKLAGRFAASYQRAGPVKALPTPPGPNPWLGSSLSTTAAEDLTMYRVWGGESARVGPWLTPVRPDSSTAARRALSLPERNAATFVSEVTVPAGARFQIGIAGPAYSQPGGSVQAQLLDEIPDASFGVGVRF
jgi:RHS repeat-associated protein